MRSCFLFNDNNKIWGSYTYQTETDNHPLSIWWAPEWTIPYPGKPVGIETAKVYLVNYTHVFNASTTNEFVFSEAQFVNDNSLQNPSAVNPSTVGFPSQSLYAGKTQDEIPGFTGGWSSGITEIGDEGFDGGIYGKGTFGKTAKAPAFTDNFTKIIKTHSLKAGFYWDTQENLQSTGGQPSGYQGVFDVENWGSSSTYNMTLDRLMGRNQTYSETNLDPVPDELWHQWSLWAQDSWKATPKLTANLGLRADHEGQWYDKDGGTQVWDQAAYVNTANPPANTGLAWAGKGNPTPGVSVPSSGWGSQLLTWNPRLGLAYDVFGTGKTVVRGGFGTYRYQVSNNDSGNAMNGPLGVFTVASGNQGINGFYGYSIAGDTVSQGVGATPAKISIPSVDNQTGSGNTIAADKMGDNKVPYANTWSFGVAQALPGHTVAQASYVGSMSRNQLLHGYPDGAYTDPNIIPYGAYFSPDPKTGQLVNPAACPEPTCTPVPPGVTPPSVPGLNSQDYRPLINYGQIQLQTHGGYANYNSLQVAAQKQSGNLFMFTNFTFGKVLGTRDGASSNGNGNGSYTNIYNLRSNYAQLAYDHTKTFNLSFSYKLPKPIHNNFLLGEAVNGWQISNYTTYEDGAPYQPNSGGEMNAQFNQALIATGPNAGLPAQTFQMPDGLYTQGIGGGEWFGSGDGPNLMPVLTCDPRHFVKTLVGQKFNPNCFAAPAPPTATTYGQNGQYVWPYIREPNYFGSDLAIFKAFKVTESQRFEVRISATNWLNHPNGQFGLAGNADNQLSFVGVSHSGPITGWSTNQNAATTGAPQNKVGYRWMQFAGKYYF